MSYTAKHIGKRIRKCRKEYNLTQEQLAEKINIAPNYLGQIENGIRGVNLTNLIKIVNTLGITFDYLMADINSEAENSDDIEAEWLALFNIRSPKERQLLVKIVSDLSNTLFD